MYNKNIYNVDGFTITEEVREITPNEANEILAKHNTKNRRANTKHVNALALNMINGTWRYNADPIRFDANGTLVDGQHRLLALAKAQKNILFKVVSGLNPDCFKAIDIEMKARNLHDLLYIDGVKDANNVGGVVNTYFALLNGNTILKGGEKSTSTNQLRLTHSVEERYNFYYSHKELFDEIVKVSRIFYKRIRIMPLSNFGGLIAHLFINKNHSFNSIIEFFNQLTIASESNCINTLRSKLVNDIGATKKMSSAYKQSLIAKVWNYYILNKDVKVLTYNPKTEGTIEFI